MPLLGTSASQNTKSFLSIDVDILVVAGGGASGFYVGGGGGAGGLLGFNAQTLTPGTYLCTVGAGAAGSKSVAVNGSNSQFGSLTQAVGGGCGAVGGGGGMFASTSGGSGGGGGSNSGREAGSAGTVGQGNAGGNSAGAGGDYGSGGGGGAGGAGQSSNAGGAGGVGSSSYSTWGLATGTGENVSGTVYYAGGGGAGISYCAGARSARPGGYGGGGIGGLWRCNGWQAVTGTAGAANTGGGAGCGNNGSGDDPSISDIALNGGSGIIIVRYLSASPKATGGTVVSSGGYQYHTFTSTQNFVFG